MRWMTWEAGRGDSGYDKKLLFEWRWWPLRCDLYLLRWPTGSYRTRHRDPKYGFMHFRVNYILKRAKRGGKFTSEKCFYSGKRLKIFRSDKPHEVSVIEEGKRYTLSFGFLLKRKEVE